MSDPNQIEPAAANEPAATTEPQLAHESPGVGNTRHSSARLVSVVLFTAIVAMSAYAAMQFARFLLAYSAVKSVVAKSPPPTASLPIQTLPPPTLELVVSASEKETLLRQLSGNRNTTKLVSKDAKDLSDDPIGYIKEIILATKDPSTPSYLVDRNLELLEQTAVRPSLVDSVSGMLTSLESRAKSDSKFEPSVEKMFQVAKKWVPRNSGGFQLTYRLERLMRNKRNTSSVARRSAIRLDLSPSLVESNTARASAAQVELLPTKSQPRKTTIPPAPSKPAPSKPAPSKPTIAEVAEKLGHSYTRKEMMQEILSSGQQGDLWRRTIDHARAVVGDAKTSDQIPAWVDQVVMGLRDKGLIEDIRVLVPDQPTIATEKQIRRFVIYAQASGDKRWATLILKSLSTARLESTWDGQKRLLKEGSLASLVATTVSSLTQGDFEATLPYIDQPTLAGAIARHIAIQNTTWPKNLVEHIFRDVTQKLATNQPPTVPRQWLNETHLDLATRNHVTGLIKNINDESRRWAVYRQLLAVVNPLEIDPQKGSFLSRSYRQGTLWSELDIVLKADRNPDFSSIAKHLSEPIQQGKTLGAEDRKSVLHRIDARLSAMIVRGEVVTPESYLLVAKRFGGVATAGILTSISSDPILADRWDSVQMLETATVIRDRLAKEGR